jgi:biopolymer transport protein ExbB
MLLLNVNTAEMVDSVQNVVGNGSESELSMSFMELAIKGGPIMIVLGVLSIIAVYIFIDRFIAIKNAGKEQKSFMDNIKNFIFEGKVDQALDNCRMNDGPLARMIEKGVMRIGRPLVDVNAAVENVGKQEVSKLERGLPLLASIAGGAPMIGFLGTVIGMVRAFYDMSMAGNNIDVQLLSNGIYTAMVTTVGGLIVGIIAYFGYNIIVARVDNLVARLEAKTTEFMDILNEPAK